MGNDQFLKTLIRPTMYSEAIASTMATRVKGNLERTKIILRQGTITKKIMTKSLLYHSLKCKANATVAVSEATNRQLVVTKASLKTNGPSIRQKSTTDNKTFKQERLLWLITNGPRTSKAP